jgi:hypothetical protein
MTTPDNNALLQLQVDAGIPHTPTPLTYELRLAVSGEGPRAYDWSDKPHRLLYDACREIERNAGQVTVLEDLCQQSYCDAMDYAAEAADLKEKNARLQEALSRQADNMAFVLNHATLPDLWYENICDELAIVRAALGDAA